MFVISNMFENFERFIKCLLVWVLSIILNTVISVRLILRYIVNFPSMSWNTKDRILMDPPTCFSNNVYGTHKYVTINVNTRTNINIYLLIIFKY